MFVRDRNDSWFQKVKVEVGTLLGLGSDEEAYITLKDIPTIQMLELKDSYEKGGQGPHGVLQGNPSIHHC